MFVHKLINRNIFLIVCFCICIGRLFLFYEIVSAKKEVSIKEKISVYDNIFVYDNANILTKKEEKDLNKLCQQYKQEDEVSIIIFTENGLQGKSRKVFLEDIYDNYYSGTVTFMLINMDENDRGVEFQGYGEAKQYFNNKRIEETYYAVLDDLKSGNYRNACKQYIESVYNYKNASSKTKINLLLLCIPISCVIGIIGVITLAGIGSGKMTTGASTYLDNEHAKILGRTDRYIRKTVTKHKKPQNNNSGSSFKSGGGTSSGGNSHSGGGGSF